jgi:hypothetical protein
LPALLLREAADQRRSEVSVPGADPPRRETGMAASLEQLARNEVLFREVNEHIAGLVGLQDGPLEFLCECSDVRCTNAIELHLEEYETVRTRRKLFVIAPGHEVQAVERVIEEHDRFMVVERTIASDLPGEVPPAG